MAEGEGAGGAARGRAGAGAVRRGAGGARAEGAGGDPGQARVHLSPRAVAGARGRRAVGVSAGASVQSGGGVARCASPAAARSRRWMRCSTGSGRRAGRATASRRCSRCCARSGIDADALADAAVKAALRANTDAALAAGVFGVPTLQVGDALFWGNDAHAFALAVLRRSGVARRSADAAHRQSAGRGIARALTHRRMQAARAMML